MLSEGIPNGSRTSVRSATASSTTAIAATHRRRRAAGAGAALPGPAPSATSCTVPPRSDELDQLGDGRPQRLARVAGAHDHALVAGTHAAQQPRVAQADRLRLP